MHKYRYMEGHQKISKGVSRRCCMGRKAERNCVFVRHAKFNNNPGLVLLGRMMAIRVNSF